ncbi:MAG: permease, partial [Oscillospiraceae bacterium]
METLRTIWDFFQNEILGMAWLKRLIGSLLNSLGLDTNGKIGGSINFFVYDMIKIMVLLGILIFIISYIQSYFPPERTKKILGRFHGITANIISALLGTVTPFCSCSSIPLFMGFTSAGLPLGVTFSFLISSPMVDLGSLVLLMSIFGWKVAVIYVIVGLVIAVAGGTLIEKLHLDEQVEEFIRNAKAIDVPQEQLRFKDRAKYAA